MAVKYASYFKDIKNTTWTINIHDDSYNGSSNDFTIKSLVINYDGQETNIFTPFLPSSCSLKIPVENAYFNSFLSDIVTGVENRFYIEILKAGSLYWIGSILPDISGQADLYYNANIVTLKAVDGLSMLKNLDYNNGGTAYTGKETVLRHLYNCLEKIPLTSLFWTDTVHFLSTSIHWYDTHHNYNSSLDPCLVTRIDHSIFYKADEKNNVVYTSTYQVLKYLCELFGAKIGFVDGVWRFWQVAEFRGTSITERNYRYSETLINQTTVNYRSQITDASNSTEFHRLKGQGFEYYPALKEVIKTFDHDTSGDLLNGVTLDYNDTANTDLGFLDSENATAKLALNATIQIDFTSSVTPALVAVIKSRILLKVGTNYAKRTASSVNESNDYGSLTWDNSISYIEFVTPLISEPNGTVSFGVQFITPPIPLDGTLEIRLELESVKDTGGNDILTNYNITGVLTNTFLEYLTSDGAETSRIFKAENSNVAGAFSEVLDLGTTPIGDAINAMTKGALEVYDGSTWEQSTAWKEKNTGTAYNISQLLVNEVQAAHRKPLLRRSGGFRGDFHAFNVLSINNEHFAIVGASFDVVRNIWEGEWYKGVHDGTGIQVLTPQSLNNGPTPTLNNGFTTTSTSLNNNGGLTVGQSGTGVSDDNDNTMLSGAQAFLGNTTGSQSLGVGLSALGDNTTGSNNVALGYEAHKSNTTGSNNVALGYQTFKNNPTGGNNVALGYKAGDKITSGDGNILLGYSAGPGTTGVHSNKLYIGNSEGTPTLFGDLATKKVAIGQESVGSGYRFEVNGVIRGTGVSVEGSTPGSKTESNKPLGSIWWDANYIYVQVESSLIKKAVLSEW